MIDDVTLTDSITHLFKQGKVANVPVLAGYVNDEGANSVTRNTTKLSPATSQVWNFTAGQVEQAASYYPVNGTFGFASPDNFFLSPFKAYMQSLHPFGEGGISGSERVVGKYVSEAFGSDRVWTFRFNAPSKFLPSTAMIIPSCNRLTNFLHPQPSGPTTAPSPTH